MAALLAAGCKLLHPLQAQHFFEQLDADIALLERCRLGLELFFLGSQLRLQSRNHGLQFSGRLATEISIGCGLSKRVAHAAYYSKNSVLNRYKSNKNTSIPDACNAAFYAPAAG